MLKPAHQLRGQMLGISGRAAIAAKKDLFPGGQAFRPSLPSFHNGRSYLRDLPNRFVVRSDNTGKNILGSHDGSMAQDLQVGLI